jgi:hypothetical protein
MNLTAENVENVIMSCLFKDGEDTTDHVKGEAVKIKIGYHPVRLKENEGNIKSMLSELPDNFKKSGGGGWSFLNACETANGEQWTGLHDTVDKLISIGIASGQVAFLMPREMWEMLPGGMPYFIVNDI